MRRANSEALLSGLVRHVKEAGGEEATGEEKVGRKREEPQGEIVSCSFISYY